MLCRNLICDLQAFEYFSPDVFQSRQMLNNVKSPQLYLILLIHLSVIPPSTLLLFPFTFSTIPLALSCWFAYSQLLLVVIDSLIYVYFFVSFQCLLFCLTRYFIHCLYLPKDAFSFSEMLSWVLVTFDKYVTINKS